MYQVGRTWLLAKMYFANKRLPPLFGSEQGILNAKKCGPERIKGVFHKAAKLSTLIQSRQCRQGVLGGDVGQPSSGQDFLEVV